MNDKCYIKFKAPKRSQATSPSFIKRLLWPIVERVLTRLIPQANPDFDKKINDVDVWLVEFEDDFPNREIGIDQSGKVIMIMPWLKNYGYWLDNNMWLENFKTHFAVKEIDALEFQNAWNTFGKNR